MDIFLLEIIKGIASGLLVGGVFLLVSLGLTTIFDTMAVVNFAHGEFLMIGMYTTLLCTPFMGGISILTLPVCAFTGAILGVGCYLGLIRHLLNGSKIAQLFGTFGLMLFLRNIVLVLMESNPQRIQHRIPIGSPFTAESNMDHFTTEFVVIIPILFLFLIIWRWINHIRTEEALCTIKIGKETISAVKWANVLVWALGGSSATVAGGIIANFWPEEPNIAMLFTAIAFAAVALGGFGNIKGTLAVGVLIGIAAQVPPVRDAMLCIAGSGTNGESFTLHSFRFTFIYLIYFLILVFMPRRMLGWE